MYSNGKGTFDDNDNFTPRDSTPLELILGKSYFVNSDNNTVIKGDNHRLILSSKEDAELANELENIAIRSAMGDEITLVEKLFLSILKGTY